MSARKKGPATGALLDLWRPPSGAGDPIGCLATTYTFAPGLFDEHCLARFLEIESEPNREDLAFLLERETRLGGVYAGVLVDHTQAGVEHSLRWDVLPVRVPAGKQHAKLSLLAWSSHVRLIVASGNLTEPGYRFNQEVAGCVDFGPERADVQTAAQALEFLRRLLELVPGTRSRPPEILRAENFLDQVERKLEGWKPAPRRETVRQRLVFTIPSVGGRQAALSSLDDAIGECRKRGGSPSEAWVASPFFDFDANTNRVAASLCKSLSRTENRSLCFCVPAIRDGTTAAVPRLAAPISLLRTAQTYDAEVKVEMLPDVDDDKNHRTWHAKMVEFRASKYRALMAGSSNFTSAGMGVGNARNAEANLLTIVDRVDYGREAGLLEALWPKMEKVSDPENAEWLGAQAEEEGEQAGDLPLPAGFLSATYRAGEIRCVVLRLDPDHLPEEWSVHAVGLEACQLLSASSWRQAGGEVVEIPWPPVQPPEKLRVQWSEGEAFLSLNVEDSRQLPLPPQLENMSADDMLSILAAADPSAAFRVWARRQQPSGPFDDDLDSATPIDLDPLHRHELQTTFLHRVRRRARVFSQLRSNLQRPVWGRQALEWRLRGMVGIAPLAERLLRECVTGDSAADEALLTLADFLIVLREVDYQQSDGALSNREFEGVYRPFLRELVNRLESQVGDQRTRLSDDMRQFWSRVVDRCRE